MQNIKNGSMTSLRDLPSLSTDASLLLEQVADRLQGLKTSYNITESNYHDSKALVKAAREMYQTTSDAREIALELAKRVQSKSLEHMGALITKAINHIYPNEDYRFALHPYESAGRTLINCTIHKGEHELDPMSSVEGGVLDIISFVLRICAVLLHKPEVSSFVILDEPFRFVSVEYRQGVREVLQMLHEKLGIQFIMVTHMEEFTCGKVITL